MSSLAIARVLALLAAAPVLSAQAPAPPYQRSLAIPGAPDALTHVSLDSVGDQNGDGGRDLVVGVPDLDTVFVFDPRTGALLYSVVSHALDASECPRSVPTNVLFGWDVASVPDLDCDGRDDLLVGAPRDFSIPACPAVRTGRAYLVGSASRAPLAYVLQPSPSSTSTGHSGEDWFGYAVAGAGADYNGDGTMDVLVGQPQSGAANAPGWVFAFALFRSAPATCIGSFFPDVAARLAGTSGALGGSRFGTSLATLELDGDSVPEIAIGAPAGRAAGAAHAAGYVRLYDGASCAAGAPVLVSELQLGAGLPAGLGFGFALARIGDRDGDGVDELAVCAPDPGNVLASVVALYSGSSLLQGGAQLLLGVAEPSGACGARELGAALSEVGDYDHDPAGTSELLIGLAELEPPSCARSSQGAGIVGADASGAGAVLRRWVLERASLRCGWDVSEIELGRSFAVADPGGLDASGTQRPPRVFVFAIP